MSDHKYRRTYHLPWSKGATNDDKILKDVSSFLNVPLVLTEKCDGSNVCMTSTECFARTHSGPPTHPSFNLFKSIHSSVKHLIPENLLIYGEYMFALHSIHYTELPGYLFLFGIKDSITNKWLSWDSVKQWANDLGVHYVPELARITVNNEKDLQNITEKYAQSPSVFGAEREGIVVRWEAGFDDADFKCRIAKIVRANHVQSDEHWAHKEIVKNLLKK